MHELHISPYFTKSVKPCATRQLGLQTTRSGKIETRESAYFVRPVNSATELLRFLSVAGRDESAEKCANARTQRITWLPPPRIDMSTKRDHFKRKFHLANHQFLGDIFLFSRVLFMFLRSNYTHPFTVSPRYGESWLVLDNPVSSELYQTQHAAIDQFYIDPVVEPPLWRILSSKYGFIFPSFTSCYICIYIYVNKPLS